MSDLIIHVSREYELVGQVGESGRVKLWTHRDTREEIAIKSYPRSHKTEQELQDEFIREIEALRTLDHPCIMKIKGCCLPTKDEDPKLISEYLGHGSLKPILGAGAKHPRWWTVTRRTNSVVGIVLGMNYIHGKCFIHRNLKPENILVDDDNRIRICDFGSSRTFEAGVTMTNAGTPLYAAPEVPDGHYDEKVDVYSFGLILYEIVSCDGLFSCPGDKTRLYLNLQKGWRPDIPSGVTSLSKHLIEKCWSESPSERPSFQEIWRELYENGFEIIPGSDRAEVDSYLSYLERHGATFDKR
jgi:serine/threonine protein kinase